jgi:hypothetical protein
MKYLDVPSSGSIADRTHSHNRAGQYTRNRRSPVQPIGTGRRAFIRSAFGSASAGWASLAPAVQEAWISFAADHPVTDALGQSVVLTGHQMFVAVGVNLLNVGESLPTNPPASVALPDISAVTSTASVAGGFSIDNFTGDSTDFVTTAYSKPMGAGRRFTKTFWQPPGALGFFAADSAPVTFTSALYAAEFGAFAVGQVIFCKITPINLDGWAGTPAIVRMVASA